MNGDDLTTSDDGLRPRLSRLLSWQEAHVGFQAMVPGLPPELDGAQPARNNGGAPGADHRNGYNRST